MKKITTALVHFPEITLSTRDAHKLRGYFGKIFKEHSPLLHNHFEDGTQRYAYPLVQYKVIDQIPVLVGFNEGAKLLIELFLKIKEIKINSKIFPVFSKNIIQKNINLSSDDELHGYVFKTLWMALNQKNYEEYRGLKPMERKNFLNKILRNNILSFYKGIDFWTVEKIMVKAELNEKTTQFKNNRMSAFEGTFITNAIIPDLAGIGKAVSRGFGTVLRKQTTT